MKTSPSNEGDWGLPCQLQKTEPLKSHTVRLHVTTVTVRMDFDHIFPVSLFEALYSSWSPYSPQVLLSYPDQSAFSFNDDLLGRGTFHTHVLYQL